MQLSPCKDPQKVESTTGALVNVLRELSVDDRIRILSGVWDVSVRPALETEVERLKLLHFGVPFPGRT